jgi:hypothetical protein
MQVGAPWELPPAALLGDLKITASAGESADVFIGIAPTSDVETYLAGVEHVTLVDVRDGDGVYRTTAGDGRPGAPASQDFWATTSAGPGTQELTWEPTNGDWSVLVMNADASKGVDGVVTAGAEVPALPWIVAVMLAIAGLTLVASVILIAVPLRRVGRTSGDR